MTTRSGGLLAAGLATLISVSLPAQNQTDAPAPPATAAIRGRIFAADTGRPLRRARVVLSAPELESNQSTQTDVEGRYEIKELPAGSYTVWVSRSGYLPISYGQRRPLEQGTPLRVGDRQLVDGVDFRLPRTGAVGGRITDETGEPMSGARVFLMRTIYFEGRRRLLPVGSNATSDSAGQYRILNVAPGSYVLMAMVRDTWTVTEDGVDRTIAYAPTYFPGTNSFTAAGRVTVGVSQQIVDADLSVLPGRAASISGRALSARLRPLVGETVYITQEFRSPDGRTEIQAGGDAPVAADGTFTIRNLPPGEYKLRMHVNGTPVEDMATAVSVDGVDVKDVQLVTSAGWSMSGQVTTENGAVPGFEPARLRIAARLTTGDRDPRTGGNPGVAQVNDDWTFTLTRVFGPARLRVNPPPGWSVKAILSNGRDISDQVLDLKRGERLERVEVILVNRVTTVAGSVADDRGGPTAGGTVIVFSTDEAKWAEDSRFVRGARPDREGQFQIRGMPPGEYFAIAIDYVPDGTWNDPEYLESIRRLAQRITLTEGGTRTVSLRLTNP